MVSTPNRPEGLFEEIELEPEDQCLYKRIFLPYHRGLEKIYTQAEIDKAHQSPQFEREYNLAYIGEQGNVFSHESIERAIELGLEVNKRYSINLIPQGTLKTMGVDPGFGSSKFAIVVTQLIDQNSKVQVIYGEEFERPDFSEMRDKIIKIYDNYSVSKIYVDSANPKIITAIKRGLNERTDYERYISNLNTRHPKFLNLATWINVIPMSFSSEGREMLAHTKRYLDNNWLAIHPSFHKLIVALRTAIATDGLLDKSQSAHNDLLDALRLSLCLYK
jgi:Terminase RNaseH-like domain